MEIKDEAPRLTEKERKVSKKKLVGLLEKETKAKFDKELDQQRRNEDVDVK